MVIEVGCVASFLELGLFFQFVCRMRDVACRVLVRWARKECRVENLEWCTHKENMQHCRHVLNRNWLGEKVPQSVLTKDQAFRIRELLARGIPSAKLARAFGVSKSAISKIKLRKSWAWI